MHYTVEELRNGWHVIQEGVAARKEREAVARASREAGAGMFRTAASLEPDRRYFWRSPGGDLEEMDR